MANNYNNMIADKIKEINQKYVNSENKKDLIVGSGVADLVDVKEGMGLRGMGFSAGNMEAGMKKYKKSKKVGGVQLGYVPPVSGRSTAISSPFIVAGGMRGDGASGGSFLDIIKAPFKLLGFGEDGELISSMEGSGIKDLFDVDKLNAFLQKAYDRKKGGSFMDFISSMAGPLALPIKILSKLTGGANNGEYMLVDDKDINDMVGGMMRIIGSGMSAGGYSAGGMSAGVLNKPKVIKPKVSNRTGNQGLIGFGKKKRGRKPKVEGGNFLDIASKIANFSPFTSTTSSNPLSQLFGDENVRNIAVDIASKMMGKGKRGRKPKSTGGAVNMGSRPTTQNMPSSSFSGGAKKKPNKRAEIVKKVMKEKNMSMIEASKYVKQNNLY
jgi:hypothetical protein